MVRYSWYSITIALLLLGTWVPSRAGDAAVTGEIFSFFNPCDVIASGQ